MRLQALIRSRVLSHKFRHLRGHIVRLQARSRGYLVRRNYEKKMWAVIKIQSHVRRMVAQRKFRKLRVSTPLMKTLTERWRLTKLCQR